MQNETVHMQHGNGDTQNGSVVSCTASGPTTAAETLRKVDAGIKCAVCHHHYNSGPPYVPAGNTGTVLATGTTPDTDNTGCSHLSQAISQTPYIAGNRHCSIGIMEGLLPYYPSRLHREQSQRVERVETPADGYSGSSTLARRLFCSASRRVRTDTASFTPSSFHASRPASVQTPASGCKYGSYNFPTHSPIMGVHILEVSLLGVGTVLRLKRDAWSIVK